MWRSGGGWVVVRLVDLVRSDDSVKRHAFLVPST